MHTPPGFSVPLFYAMYTNACAPPCTWHCGSDGGLKQSLCPGKIHSFQAVETLLSNCE